MDPFSESTPKASDNKENDAKISLTLNQMWTYILVTFIYIHPRKNQIYSEVLWKTSCLYIIWKWRLN